MIAIAVALHIVWTGAVLMRQLLCRAARRESDGASGGGKDLRQYRHRHGVDFHALRTRQAGSRHFISFHLLVPTSGRWCTRPELSEIEERIRELVPDTIFLTHIEPISQPASYDDIATAVIRVDGAPPLATQLSLQVNRRGEARSTGGSSPSSMLAISSPPGSPTTTRATMGERSVRARIATFPGSPPAASGRAPQRRRRRGRQFQDPVRVKRRRICSRRARLPAWLSARNSGSASSMS